MSVMLRDTNKKGGNVICSSSSRSNSSSSNSSSNSCSSDSSSNGASGRMGIPVVPLEQRRRIVVDFSSPNIAKEMHVVSA